MYDQSATVQTFLDAAAAKQPTPGGGSVAALAGALAASMGEMVLNYSVGKKSLAAHAGELKAALDELHRARGLLLQLMAEDQEGYAALTAARKLPDGSPERAAQEGPALAASIRAPQAIAATAIAMLETCDRVVDVVNFHLLSDLAIAADLAMATARCGAYNVRVNLPDVADPAERAAIEATMGQLQSRALTLIQRVAPRIWARYAKGAA